MATIGGIKQMKMREEMCGPPTSDEVLAALSKIKGSR